MDLQTQLLSDYNYYRSHTRDVVQRRAVAPVRDLKETKNRLDVLRDMVGWCTQQQVDPRLWLYMLFDLRSWTFAPNFNQLVPKSKRTAKKNLERYANLSNIPLFQKRIAAETRQAAEADGRVFDPNRDVSYSAEALKRRFLNAGDWARCLEEMDTRTFGFHPRSLVCARCPVAAQCEQALQAKVPFDITALRREQITTQQAMGQAAHYER